ncbi:MAG: hypothetical protein KAR00_03090 [Candidatus Pacebacteria bacterium]|nr:hypothetical protein [Candidatus Paceibacterota bacterium]
MKGFLTKTVFVFGTLSLAFSVCAETTIINTVSSSANSGGNTAGDGQVAESSAKASVDVKTTVNGVTVQEVHKTVEGTESVEINESHTYEGGNASVKTNISVKANATTSASEVPAKAFLSRLFENIFGGGKVSEKENAEEHISERIAITEKIQNEETGMSTQKNSSGATEKLAGNDGKTEKVPPAKQFSLFKKVSNFLKNVFSWFTTK